MYRELNYMKGFAMRLISIFLFFVVAIAEGGDIVSNVNKESDLHMRSIFISDGSKKVTGPRKGEKARLRARWSRIRMKSAVRLGDRRLFQRNQQYNYDPYRLPGH